ncbi:hypothetical protein F4V43_18420 [Paenibacillus spiritus]|uniref:Uncharacterized protein n=1 Tax=Paenibacillus spiritus TaxID=2496557 RepID=A0A5J5FTJ1_9BACL|nr:MULTISPECIES: hypothetical protein [Paenibacillus]KAA8996854.1 hypothetical protein F4V43_18420 [Paenibacillus spiritus]
MNQENQVKEPGTSDPAVNDATSDWGASDGFSLWEQQAEDGQWLKDWEGRKETHDMFHDSYE